MKIIIYLLLLFCFACSSLKKNRQQSKTKTISNTESQLVAEVHQLQWSVTNDSIAKEYEISIKPKGSFKFDISSGFEGEADWLGVKGRHIENRVEKKASYKTAEMQNVTNISKRQKDNNQALAVSRSSTKFMLLIIVVFVSIVILWFAKKYFTS